MKTEYKYKHRCKICTTRRVETANSRCSICRKNGRVFGARENSLKVKEKHIQWQINKINQHLSVLEKTNTKQPVAMWETISYWKNKRNQLKQSINGSTGNN